MRLTKAIKQQILDAAIAKSPLVKDAERLIEERAEIAEKLRRVFISKEVDDYISSVQAKFSELSSGKENLDIGTCHASSNIIKINFNGQVLDLPFSGYSRALHNQLGVKPKERVSNKPVSYFNQSYSVKDDFGAFKNNDDIDALVEKSIELKMAVNAILSKANTDGQLLKLWPECKELIPKERVKPSTALIVNPSELNTLIGLPS